MKMWSISIGVLTILLSFSINSSADYKIGWSDITVRTVLSDDTPIENALVSIGAAATHYSFHLDCSDGGVFPHPGNCLKWKSIGGQMLLTSATGTTKITASSLSKKNKNWNSAQGSSSFYSGVYIKKCNGNKSPSQASDSISMFIINVDVKCSFDGSPFVNSPDVPYFVDGAQLPKDVVCKVSLSSAKYKEYLERAQKTCKFEL